MEDEKEDNEDDQKMMEDDEEEEVEEGEIVEDEKEEGEVEEVGYACHLGIPHRVLHEAYVADCRRFEEAGMSSLSEALWQERVRAEILVFAFWLDIAAVFPGVCAFL